MLFYPSILGLPSTGPLSFQCKVKGTLIKGLWLTLGSLPSPLLPVLTLLRRAWEHMGEDLFPTSKLQTNVSPLTSILLTETFML